jgi:hypothetical protein
MIPLFKEYDRGKWGVCGICMAIGVTDVHNLALCVTAGVRLLLGVHGLESSGVCPISREG